MRVKVLTDTSSSDLEGKINQIISVNKDSDIEIKYSTCTRNGGGVHHSAIVIITPNKPQKH